MFRVLSLTTFVSIFECSVPVCCWLRFGVPLWQSVWSPLLEAASLVVVNKIEQTDWLEKRQSFASMKHISKGIVLLYNYVPQLGPTAFVISILSPRLQNERWEHYLAQTKQPHRHGRVKKAQWTKAIVFLTQYSKPIFGGKVSLDAQQLRTLIICGSVQERYSKNRKENAWPFCYEVYLSNSISKFNKKIAHILTDECHCDEHIWDGSKEPGPL